MIKIAVISDIHGNLPALKAVVGDLEAWNPDRVIVNGDIVNRGPRSAECLHFVHNKQNEDGWHLLRGNHENYVLEVARPDFPLSGPAFELRRFAYWSLQQLNGGVEIIRNLPEQFSLQDPDGGEFRVVHASMNAIRQGIFVDSPAEKLLSQIAPAPAVFVTSHTHEPFVRRLAETLIVNTGSVGAPFDYDWRPSYGRFTWTQDGSWQAEIVRLFYDRRLIERDYVDTGFLEGAGPLAQLMLIELRRSRGLIFRWASQYEKAVRSGEIEIEESVRRVLAEDDIRPFLRSPGWVLI